MAFTTEYLAIWSTFTVRNRLHMRTVHATVIVKVYMLSCKSFIMMPHCLTFLYTIVLVI